jgi:hypothetical protein
VVAKWANSGELRRFSVQVDGECPADMQSLYRFYNGGRGGAPNHRYVTDQAARGSLLVQGWVPEGMGSGVAGCVPLQAY